MQKNFTPKTPCISQSAVIIFHHNFFEKAWNGTLIRGNDRNAASPTESAACESWSWEHPGADYLKVLSQERPAGSEDRSVG